MYCRAYCRDDTKKGACPKVSRADAALAGESECESACQTDGNCEGDKKCCYVGPPCDLVCVDPVEDPGAEIPDYGGGYPEYPPYGGGYEGGRRPPPPTRAPPPTPPVRPQDPNAPKIQASSMVSVR